MLLAAALVSCQKESGSSSIQFQARTSWHQGEAGTKTTYTGDVTSEQVSGNTKKTERIDWTEGDLIRVYCPQAYASGSADTHFSDYAVSSTSSSGTVCTATIVSDGNGLQWGSGSHDFYAMYPSPDTEGLEGASFDDGTMVFTMPSEQTIIRKDESSLAFDPDMRYAPMLAEASIGSAGSSVSLDFSPKYTAYEFTINKGSLATIHLTRFTLTSTTGYLTGCYTINKGAYDTVASVTNGGKSITVDMSGIVLDADNATLSFMVLALPQTVSGLELFFEGEEIGVRSFKLNKSDGTPISLAPFRKYFISGISLPAPVGANLDDSIFWNGSIYYFDDTVHWLNKEVNTGDGFHWNQLDHVELNDDSDAYLWCGDVISRSATAYASPVDAPVHIYWSSSNTDVVTVDRFVGRVTAIAPGEATVTATALIDHYLGDALSTSYKVYVNAPTAITLTASDDASLFPGTSKTLTATVSFTSYGNAPSYPADLLAWSVDSSEYVSLSDAQNQPALETGIATAVATGVAVGGVSNVTVAVAPQYAASLSASIAVECGIDIVQTSDFTGRFRGLVLSPGILKWDAELNGGAGGYTITDGEDQLFLLNWFGDDSAIDVYYHEWNDVNNPNCLKYRLDGNNNTSESIQGTVTVGNQVWRIPSKTDWETIISGAVTSTINGVPARISDVYLYLTGSPYEGKGYGDHAEENADYIAGCFIIPDGLVITCPGMLADNTTFPDPDHSVSYAVFRSLINSGCIFIPRIGSYSATPSEPDWFYPGFTVSCWTSTEGTTDFPNSSPSAYVFKAYVSETKVSIVYSQLNYNPVYMVHD